MSKVTPNKIVADLNKFSKSTFTLTFAIEILSMDIWHDCNEGWLDLGPYHQAIKIQYQLYPGQNYDLDILIWPHVVKIWCGSQFGYVRTWQFLERRWFTFSIRHAFVARVLDLKNHTATVTCFMGGGNLSNNAKNDKNVEAYLPPLKFGERRYFGSVLEKEKTFEEFIQNLLWNLIEIHIPASYLDGAFDTPSNVTDVRHQDAILYNIREEILKKDDLIERESLTESEQIIKPKDRRESKLVKEKVKKRPTEVQKEKYAIYLSGNTILAGSGRITMFNSSGDRPPDQSNTIVLISSKNLPSYDDLPIIFVNIEKIYDLPMEEFKKARISQIYTRWIIGDEEHDSQKQDIKSPKPINFNDYHTVPLQLSKAFDITTAFIDDPFEIQLRGVRQPNLIYSNPIFFGQEKNCHFNSISSNINKDNQDILIAITKIDLSHLAKGNNELIRGEFPLYPPKVSVVYDSSKSCCTNYMNAIGLEVKPHVVIQSFVVLQAQMTIETTIGLVGCKAKKIVEGYSRLYCQTCNSQAVNAILMEISRINEHSMTSKDSNSILTGFVLDTRDEIIFYIEGPKNGEILKIWKIIKDFYTKVLVHFSCSEQHLDRIYPKLLSTNMSFNMLRTYTTVNSLLGLPQAYVKPTLPIPARTRRVIRKYCWQALLKIGRLIASKFKVAPCKSEMPTNEELESFKLELCVPYLFESDMNGKKTLP